MHWRCRGMGRGPIDTQRRETNEAMKSQDKEIGWQETHTDGHNPHCFVRCCGSHGKREKILKGVLILSVKMQFVCRMRKNYFKWNHIWPTSQSGNIFAFPSACVCVCKGVYVCVCVCLQQTRGPLQPACFLCVCACGVLWVWTVCLAAHADCNLACHI